MMQPTTLMSQISFPPSPLSILSLFSLSLGRATLAHQIDGCKKLSSTAMIAGVPVELVCPNRVISPRTQDRDHFAGKMHEKFLGKDSKSPKGSSEDSEREETLAIEVETPSDGEYILRIKWSIPSSKNKVERATQMAHSASLLLVHAKILRDMGDKLLAQSRASFQSKIMNLAPSKSK